MDSNDRKVIDIPISIYRQFVKSVMMMTILVANIDTLIIVQMGFMQGGLI